MTYEAWKYKRITRVEDLRKPGGWAIVTIWGLGGPLAIEETFDDIVARLRALGVEPDLIE